MKKQLFFGSGYCRSGFFFVIFRYALGLRQAIHSPVLQNTVLQQRNYTVGNATMIIMFAQRKGFLQ